jgi:hypothetical protein
VSFAERNKRWLLPTLAVAVAGVVWSNLPLRPAPEPEPPVPSADGAVLAGGAAPAAAAAPPGAGANGSAGEAGLKALEATPPEANATGPLLLAGRRALAGALRQEFAVLHPEQWRNLYQPPLPRTAQPPKPAAGPPPPLDFIIQTDTRREAWMNGHGFQQGAALGDGYVLKRITADGVVLAGPAGDVAVPLRARAQAPEAGSAQRRGGRP